MALTNYPSFLLISLDGNGDIQTQDDLSISGTESQLSGDETARKAFLNWYRGVQTGDFMISGNYVVVRRNG